MFHPRDIARTIIVCKVDQRFDESEGFLVCYSRIWATNLIFSHMPLGLISWLISRAQMSLEFRRVLLVSSNGGEDFVAN